MRGDNAHGTNVIVSAVKFLVELVQFADALAGHDVPERAFQSVNAGLNHVPVVMNLFLEPDWVTLLVDSHDRKHDAVRTEV